LTLSDLCVLQQYPSTNLDAWNFSSDGFFFLGFPSFPLRLFLVSSFFLCKQGGIRCISIVLTHLFCSFSGFGPVTVKFVYYQGNVFRVWLRHFFLLGGFLGGIIFFSSFFWY